MEEMSPRERLLATVAFEPVDRPFRMETIGYWADRTSGPLKPLDAIIRI